MYFIIQALGSVTEIYLVFHGIPENYITPGTSGCPHSPPEKLPTPLTHHLPLQLFVCLCVRCGIGILEGPDTTSMGLTRTKD